MKTASAILIVVALLGLIALASVTRSVSQTVQPSYSPGSRPILVFAYRAPSHVKHGKLQDFTTIVDDFIRFLNANGASLANDQIHKPIISEEALPNETLASYIRDAGARRLLYVTLERPTTLNFKVVLRCYDAQGAFSGKQWSKRTLCVEVRR